MSKSINPMLFLNPEASPSRPGPRFIVSMSLQTAIPWRVALQHCPPPLHRPVSILRSTPEVICQPFTSVFLDFREPDKANYQYMGGPNQMIEVGQAGVSNSTLSGSSARAPDSVAWCLASASSLTNPAGRSEAGPAFLSARRYAGPGQEMSFSGTAIRRWANQAHRFE